MTRQTTSLNLSELWRDWRHSEGNIEIENQLEGDLQYKWNYVDPYFLKLSNTMICLHSDPHLTQLVNFFSCFKHWLTLRTTFHTFAGTKIDLVDVFLHGAMRSLLQAFLFLMIHLKEIEARSKFIFCLNHMQTLENSNCCVVTCCKAQARPAFAPSGPCRKSAWNAAEISGTSIQVFWCCFLWQQSWTIVESVQSITTSILPMP